MCVPEMTVRARRALMTPRSRAADEALIECAECGCWHDENDDCRFEDVARFADHRAELARRMGLS